ncbi:DUF5686 family protein [Aquimarina hainanensis]|uniref:DUF5686 family protein n=1 Tax=Aquimarina hainanensis TaxID=1578017 RepID=A0ABW5N6A9_9FLAO
MRNILLCLSFLTPFLLCSQINISGKIIDQSTNNPLPFATIKTNHSDYALSDSTGEFSIHCQELPLKITVSYIGYITKNLTIASADIDKIEFYLTPKTEKLDPIEIDSDGNIASKIIRKAIRKRPLNNPKSKLNSYSYKTYNKFKITGKNKGKLESKDTADVDIEHIFNETHSFLSEKISEYQYLKNKGEKETILATRMTGFEEPVYNVLGIKIQSNTLYEEDYTILDNKYAGPLSKRAIKNYYFKILDTTKGKRPAYVILFQPRRSKRVASLEGVLYLDMETLAIQKAIAEVRGELNIMATHNYHYYEEQNLWFPSNQEVSIQSGKGRQKVALFGGRISIGRLGNTKKTSKENNGFLISKTDYFDITLNPPIQLSAKRAAIEIHPEASNRPDTYWEQYRTSEITEKDENSFPVIADIVKKQNIEHKIRVIQNFNLGYYPLSIINFDLTYPIKYNNYEGLRLGIGMLSNEKLSKRFRIEGYLTYGFRDNAFKYGVGTGILLNKDARTWLNFNYTDDLSEVGSFLYLTDRRVYSLFEPRLVNIDFYYKHQTWSSSLQYQILPKLLSEAQISLGDIYQTGGYRYVKNNIAHSSYKLAESTIAIRWSPFSEFLKTPDGYREVQEGFPKITAQYTQAYKGVLNSDFQYAKFGIKAEYTINRLNESSTSFLLEGNLASGDVPLTHLYHAYPNAPTKETIMQRFSVAGRSSFETMYFSEFFSNKLASLQIRHTLKPFKITSWLKPELSFINRYAIGDVDNIEDHQGIEFKSLKHGYQESGIEINKLFAGFGLSFSYRYGAYHLPNFGDNIAFKFTFYLKL